MSLEAWRQAWGSHALSLVERRRAQAILQRIRALSFFFAVTSVAWIPMDVVLFETPIARSIALVRFLGAFALLALAAASDAPNGTMREARRRSVVLFAIPALFYIASLQIFHLEQFDGTAAAVVNAYSFAPFLIAAGIAVFPLSAVESAALLLIALAAQAFALQWHLGETPFITGEALWMQLLIGAVASFAALSQRKLLGELVMQAVKDPLTACHRRESGREMLGMHFHLARRRSAPLAVLFVDLDEFKRVNDKLGHDAGDHALAAVAASMRSGMRLSDVLVRWGGEEFLMVLPDTRFGDAVAIAERVRASSAFTLPDGSRMTLSIGIAERMHDDVDDPDTLVDLADRRMYRAKQAGRNRCVSTGDAPHHVHIAIA
jgi:diguanylate cyclase (GGDEF)-like protein